jgi:FdhE protein
VASTGPEILAREASHLLDLAPAARRARVLPEGPGRWWTRADAGLSFPTIVLLQPCLATLTLERAHEEVPAGTCPYCGAGAPVGLLREDPSASSRRRTLQCSLCSREWDCPRVTCPDCGEQRPDKLPRYETEDIPGIRIDACDSCSRYLKTIDFSRRPGAEPVVDELASTPLDVIAREKGYAKSVQNFAGL